MTKIMNTPATHGDVQELIEGNPDIGDPTELLQYVTKKATGERYLQSVFFFSMPVTKWKVEGAHHSTGGGATRSGPITELKREHE